jgi:pyruvate kinase
MPNQSRAEYRRLFDELCLIRAEMLDAERDLAGCSAAPRGQSARNLLHYLALRRRDLRPLQERLARLGFSSLGRCEAHALSSIDAVIHLLARLLGTTPALPPSAGSPDFEQGPSLLDANTNALFGPSPKGRATRIMVTLSTELADDPGLARQLIEAGTDAVRINCAHDDEATWAAMVKNVRFAARELGRTCAIHFDLGGPKLRTGANAPTVSLAPGDSLLLLRATDLPVGPKVPKATSCTIPAALDQVRTGQQVWFDDGKLGGLVDAVGPEGVTVRITYARKGKRKLRPDRGINFPDSAIDIAGFTDDDRHDLAFVVRHADTVGLSFAQSLDDIRAVHQRLAELGAPRVGLVLKIETRRGFEALPRLLLEPAGDHAVGVMIARGDLALEVGYERLAEVQEEILWICEAAHTPVIWATQVLETLSRHGMPTRAEVTDAAMSERAECVMLNKGTHVTEAVQILDRILKRMETHQRKKSPTLRLLRVSGDRTPRVSARARAALVTGAGEP